MHKQFFAAPALLIIFITTAAAQKGIDGVINAEKSFAAYAVQHNSRDAFMHFLDSTDAIEFRGGEVKKSYDIWSTHKIDSSKLIWQPAFAGVSASGDMGFTTGPWEYKKSMDDTSIAAGAFATIWHLNDKGEWKYLLDMGTGFDLPAYTTATIQKWEGKAMANAAISDAVTVDNNFIEQYRKTQNDAFKGIVGDNAWFIQQGYKPVAGRQNVLASLQNIPAGLEFIPLGGGISSSKDMVYVYGALKHDGKTQNYLRVWQTTANGDKLVLQVLQF